MNIFFTVPGEPKGKGRPRFTRSGHAYTPKETTEYEKKVVRAWKENGASTFQTGTPLSVSIHAYFPIPQSYSKKKQEALNGEFHIKKPDADNVAKAVLDALNGCLYEDDSAICSLTVVKRYDTNPRVDLSVMDCGVMEC